MDDSLDRAAAAGDAICDSGMLSLLSVEESELAMMAAYGGTWILWRKVDGGKEPPKL